MNAPRSWPNSSLSSSDSESAAQLRRTNGRSARGDQPWMVARQDLLADAGLAEDQHRDVGAGGAGREGFDAAHAAVGTSPVARSSPRARAAARASSAAALDPSAG